MFILASKLAKHTFFVDKAYNYNILELKDTTNKS